VLGSDLAGLLEYASEHNPELAASRFDADAAAQRTESVASLPDPVLRAELMDITNRGMDKSPNLLPSQVGSTKYTIMQSVPWYGKRDLKRDAAAASADEAQGRTAATWAELSAQIKSAYAQYFFVTGSQKITGDLLDLVVQMEKVAQVRYANGLAAQQDAVRAQVEQTAIKTGLVALGSNRRQVEARLNALLSRPANMPLAAPQNLRSIPAISLENQAVLEERVRQHNPELFADDAGIRASEKNRDLAYRGRYPDLLLGISPTQSGNAVREWGVMVELNIPLQQGARRSQERESEATLAAARARKEATANRLLSALTENLAGIEAARSTEQLSSNGLLPQANATFESAMAGYQTGKVDFATMLDAARQILNARLEVLKAQADAQMRLAEIERLLGEEL
jgi:outer membrane protein TolC